MIETHTIQPLRRIFQNRTAMLLLLIGIQGLFFAINLTNSLVREPTDGWELKIAAIDNHLIPMPIWVIPYMLGNVLAIAVPLWAAFTMPNRIFRQYLLAMAFAATMSYVIYLIFPTYVIKPELHEVRGNSVLAHTLRDMYEADNAYSTHNAAPSQHVFYVLLSMMFVIRFRPQAHAFWLWTTMATLISASALLTRQHHTPDLIAGYVMAVVAYRIGLIWGNRVTNWFNDADDPFRAPFVNWRRPQKSKQQGFHTRADSV